MSKIATLGLLIAVIIPTQSFRRSVPLPTMQTPDVAQRYGGGRIVYNINLPYPTPGYAPEQRIGIVDVDGSHAMTITANQNQFKTLHLDNAPHWSPNGKYIAFDATSYVTLSDANKQEILYIIDASTKKLLGSGVVMLNISEFGPSIQWRPDSSALAYEAMDPKSYVYKIHIVNIDGTQDHIFLDNSPDVSISRGSWSADGKHFLFFIQSPDNQPKSPGRHWIVSDPDGSNQHIVGGQDRVINWYPVGNALSVSDAQGTVQVVDLATGAVIKTVTYPHDYAYEYLPDQWSPDGRYLSFVPQPDKNADTHIDVLDSTDNHMSRLDTQPGDYHNDISWSPNSQCLVVSATLDQGDGTGLYILCVADKSTTTLITGSQDVRRPDWWKPPLSQSTG